MKKYFIECILTWYNQHKRQLPWKETKNPYHIWLSEIILQQTRVEQGWKYYEAFIKQYPHIQSLAAAPREEVFRLWQGLGYYARCRNMLETAKEIVEKQDGHFPDDYESIRKLKGVGPYTAAAIASFAFGLPHAVLDGNVYRVLSRYFGIGQPIDSLAGKKYFTSLADELLDRQDPAAYNQAIMDFGATVCKPQKPLCLSCPLAAKCIALAESRVNALPVKEKKVKVTKRFFNYLFINCNGKIYIRERLQKDIWQHLYEFLLIEEGHLLSKEELLNHSEFNKIFSEPSVITGISDVYRQQLTHQRIFGRFVFIKTDCLPVLPEGFIQVFPEQLDKYAFPKLIISFLKEKTLTLFAL